MSFFFQAEDGIRDLVRSRGLGDVYKRQELGAGPGAGWPAVPAAVAVPQRDRAAERDDGGPPLSLIHI